MQKFILIVALFTMACTGQNKHNHTTEKQISETIKTAEFELVSVTNATGLLVLFPCFPCDAENTLFEFNIADICAQNGFSVLAMNLNQRLYLTSTEQLHLANQLTAIVRQFHLPEKNVFIGGFSSGGNISLLLSNYLLENNNPIQPKGVFAVDAPVDLLGLYRTSERNLERNLSETTLQESTWLKDFFNKTFGSPENGITLYEKNAPFTSITQNIDNLSALKPIKIRFYTEPDLKWWAEYANNDYQDLNAFYLEKLSDQLKVAFGPKNVELIKTENQGYRKNGERHPHSWSIVNAEDLVNWMLD